MIFATIRSRLLLKARVNSRESFNQCRRLFKNTASLFIVYFIHLLQLQILMNATKYRTFVEGENVRTHLAVLCVCARMVISTTKRNGNAKVSVSHIIFILYFYFFLYIVLFFHAIHKFVYYSVRVNTKMSNISGSRLFTIFCLFYQKTDRICRLFEYDICS